MQVKDVLVQSGLHKALKERPSGEASEKMSNDDDPVEANGGSRREFKKSNMSNKDWE